MNKERLLQVADVVEKNHHKFNGVHAALDMGEWIKPISDFPNGFKRDYLRSRDPILHDCNTVACIAGFTCLMFDYDTYKDGYIFGDDKTSVIVMAAALLDLGITDAKMLFLGYTNSDVTGPEAASVIRHFVKTGKVDWSPIIKKYNKHYYSD